MVLGIAYGAKSRLVDLKLPTCSEIQMSVDKEGATDANLLSYSF